MYRKLVLALALALPAALYGQKQEVRELQRDVANLSGDIRALQQTMGELRALVQQNLDLSQKSSTNIAVLDSAIRDRIKEQLAVPVAALNTRLDQMTSDFQTMRESVNDLSARIGRLQQQMEDVSNALKVLQAPPAPPPTTAAPGATTTGGPATPPPGMSASDLYNNAMRDRSGGNLDLAMQGFQQYLQFYGTTDLAPNAQFYVGQILYDKGDFAGAAQAFDTVLERYPENNKTPDAMYMKGMTMLRAGQRTDAGRVFLDVIEKFPRSEVAEKAKAQRRNLGLSVPGTTAAKPARRRR